ncbi:MAG: flagellin [Legionella sp.]|uniref:flagellin N-terminal helical domain-containing protein n=1 Tax=Legionella sp. TaxID=459 RepID=UPI0039E2E472
MAQVINTNVPSLMAQRNLAKTTDAMSTSIQRLSSGLRINSAKDDAAGLAIATLMTSQILGLNQAAQNSNDAISLAQIAEGGMGTATDILQQMRQLAVQAANGTNASADRQALQDEVSQLIDELDDIANNTQFNGQSILNGAFSNTIFQIGANANETTSFSINSIAATAVGYLASVTGSAVPVGLPADVASDITIRIGGTEGTTTIATSANYAGTLNGQDGTSAYAKAAAINAANISGLSVIANASGAAAAITGGTFGTTAGDVYSLAINGITVFDNQDVSGGMTVTSLVAGINGQTTQTGVTASIDSTGTIVTLAAADGRTITVDETGTNIGGAAADVLTTGNFAPGATPQVGTLAGELTITAQNIIYFGGTIANLGLTSATIMTDSVGINSLDITTQTGAETAIQRIDSALTSITANRAAMGAMENRFEATIANLQNISDNTEAARSRIQDTDYAAEMANLTKNQILQQAGTAMLAQANSMPQSVLSLLNA